MKHRHSGFILTIGLLCLCHISYASGLKNDIREKSTLTTKGDVETFSTVRTRLGVSADNSVLQCDSNTSTGLKWGTALSTVTSSDITGILDITHGGTSQSSAQAAVNVLTDVSSATNEWVLTKDTATGNAKFKAASGGFFTESGTKDYLTATGNHLIIGTTVSVDNAKFSVLGTQDDVVAAFKAHSTQTKNILEVLSNDNTVLFAISRDSTSTIGGATSNITFTQNSTYISGDTTNKVSLGKIGSENIRIDLGTTANVVSLDSTTGVTLLDTGTIGVRVVSIDVGAIAPISIQTADSTTIALDASKGSYFWVQLTGQPRNLSEISNGKLGQKVVFMISQDSTGSRKIGIGPTTGSKFSFGTTITSYDATTTAGMHDYIGFIKGPISWDVVAVDYGHR